MTRQEAINAFCKGCIYDQHSIGTWREQVQACTCKNCPLYIYRPLPTYAIDRKPATENQLKSLEKARKAKQETA